MLPRTALRIGGLVLAAACGSDNCIIPPCAPLHAAIINVTSSISGSRVPGAFVKVNGGDVQPCNQSDTTVCFVDAAVGTSQIEIGAPGLASIVQTITFSVTQTSSCGCPTGNTQTINVTLSPPPPPAD